jgi:surface antigen
MLTLAVAALAPAVVQAKPSIVDTQAKLSRTGLLTVQGRVEPAQPRWRVGIEFRQRGKGEARWGPARAFSGLDDQGRFRIRKQIAAATVVVRPVVLARHRILARGPALAASKGRAGTRPASDEDQAAPSLEVADVPSSKGSGPEGLSQLLPGETLPAGADLISPNHQYRLVMQTDGNLVLYQGASALWSSGTDGSPGAYAVMQTDGNLVVYLGGVAKWNSHTNGFDGAYLSLQDDSNLVIYGSGHPLWDRGRGYLGDSLRAGWTLTPGAFLLSSDRQYRLVMQGDGNLVLYKGPTALWSSGTDGYAGAHAVMQGDGNLVVYDGAVARWNSNTNGFDGAFLALQDDSNLVIYGDGHPLWDRGSGFMGHLLRAGWSLKSGAFLISPNHQYRLVMQTDGNLVLYQGASALWSSGTDGNAGAHAVMQTDGNLVVYAGAVAKWQSNSDGFNGASLVLQDDSNLVIYQGSAVWDRSHGLFELGVTEGQWPGTSGPVAAHDAYGYPYPGAPQCTAGGACVTDSWLFYQGQCVSWVAYRLNQLNGFGFSNYFGGHQWGDASNWDNTAAAEGIAMNGTPALGSVAWYPAHVAYVEKVISPTEVVISEMNYDFGNGFRVRRISTSAGWPSAFIHIHDR